MKILKILIFSPPNRLTQLLTEYLLDAGHEVDQYSEINPTPVKAKEYDYIIDFSNQSMHFSHPTISLALHLHSPKQFAATIILQHRHRSLHLADKKIDFSCDDFEQFYHELNELLIDSIVLLLRTEPDLLPLFTPPSLTAISFTSILELDSKLQELTTHYAESEAQDQPIFSLKNLIFDSATTHSQFVTTVMLDTSEVEILLLYLLILLNARQASLLKYDYALQGKITKHLLIAPTDTYASLLKKIKDPRYDFKEYLFFQGLHQKNPTAEITLSIDSPHNSLDVTAQFITIEYHSHTQQLKITYAKSLYFFDQLHDYVTYFSNLIHAFKQSNSPLSTLLRTDPTFYTEQLTNLNPPYKKGPQPKAVHTLFEEQVAAHPDQIALIGENKTFNYAELNLAANQLAHYLCKHYSLQPEDLIGICMDRDERIIITMLAILKAGCAYVPIDPMSPDIRISKILEETHIKVLLTHEAHLTKMRRIDVRGIEILSVDTDQFAKILLRQMQANLPLRSFAHSLAYVMYTSGTTGSPKGVMIEHRGITSLVKGVRYIRISTKDTLVQMADLSFDAATFEIWGALLNGAKLYFPTSPLDLLANARLFSNLLSTQAISILWLTKTLFDQLYLQDHSLFHHLNYLLIGGEALNHKLVYALATSQYRPKHFLNCYGPTENTTFSTTYPIVADQIAHLHSVPIGRPFENRAAYVLDSSLNLLPCGVVGELYLAGAGLSRGYLRHPTLTKSKFVANPFRKGHLYKTGDLARWLPSGQLEFMGRTDFQIKIRGYRVELTEIEAKLKAYPGVKQAIVIVKERLGEDPRADKKILLAYYLSDQKIDGLKIQHYLRTQLPEYMLPTAVMQLEKVPLIANGKVDLSRLPTPQYSIDQKHVAPRDPLEKLITQIWSNTLIIPEDSLGIYDDFFDLGGNSISLIRINHQLNARGCILNMKDILQCRNIANLAAFLKTHQQENFIDPVFQKGKQHQPWSGLANNLQQGFVAHYLKSGKDSYVVQIVFDYLQTLNTNILKAAWQAALNHFDGLRLKFSWDQGKVMQHVTSFTLLPWSEHDLTSLSPQEQTRQIENLLHTDQTNFYDLTQALLFRIYLIKLSDHHYTFILSNHHSILDGWGIKILFQYVHQAYFKILKGESWEDEPDPFEHCQSHLAQCLNDDDVFWLNTLKGLKPYDELEGLAGFSLNHQNACFQSNHKTSLKINSTLYHHLLQSARNAGVSLNCLFQFSWHKVIQIFTQEQYTAVGTIVSGRNSNCPGIVDAVGLFTNRVPLIVHWDNRHSVLAQLQMIQDGIIEINDKTNVNQATLQNLIPCNNSFLFEDTQDFVRHENLNITHFEYRYQLEFPINLEIFKRGDGIEIKFGYDNRIFSQERIEYLRAYLLHILEEIDLNMYKSHQVFNRLLPADYAHLMAQYAPPTKASPHRLHQLFETQVDRTPHHIALLYGDRSFTYTELNSKANQLARHLQKHYLAEHNPLVALYLNRNEDIVIAIIALLKLGAGYVPLDPNHPDERIKYILENSATQLILTHQVHLKKLTHLSDHLELSLLALDAQPLQNALTPYPHHNLNLQTIQAEDLVYVLYTSGTTGTPKGVMLTQQACVPRILSMKEHNGLTDQDIMLFKTNYIFDVSFSDLFTTLLSGAKLVMTKAVFDIDEIRELLTSQQVSICHFVPSQFAVFAPTVDFKTEFPTLKKIMFSGEKLTNSLLQPLNDSHYTLLNYYGPTETGEVFLHQFDCKNGSLDDARLSNIGRPLEHVQYHVVDQNLQLLPLGAIGELCISGIALARGYLNNPALTQEKFLHNPFQPHTILYRTGDLVRHLANGDLEYLGRNDTQVKIRGHRIELSEIEACLLDHPQIQQAIVLTHQENLVAYYVACTTLSPQQILDHLNQYLPQYMLPATFIALKKLPLTPNGKLDHKALPQPDFISQKPIEPPANELEDLICAAYAEILGFSKAKISRNHDFFELGGNSISGIRLVTKLQENFKISLTNLFKFKTPAKIAEFSPFVRNNLKQKLAEIKLRYANHTDQPTVIDTSEIAAKKAKGYAEAQRLIKHPHRKPIHHVLLTGATGYLGANILYQLLTNTNYSLSLLIRAPSDKIAAERVFAQYKFYFNLDLSQHTERIHIYAGNLEKDHLGLDLTRYDLLTAQIDSIIHAAALVKHYGHYQDFYQANVQSTINLLEFAKLTHQKDFHYISTTGVFFTGQVKHAQEWVVDEQDDPQILAARQQNVYLQTKYQGELAVHKYRAQGVHANIYRVGNLAIHSKNYKTQHNLEDNAFFIRIKTMLSLKMISKEIAEVEISPVDSTACAIVKLFDQANLSNQIFHLFNPTSVDLLQLFAEIPTLNIQEISIDEFIDNILIKLENHLNNKQIELFMLHQGWLQEEDDQITHVQLLQEKTNHILSSLGFSWPVITKTMLSNLIQQALHKGSNYVKKNTG